MPHTRWSIHRPRSRSRVTSDPTTPAYGHAHYVGAAATLAIAWLASIALGATIGAALPRELRLEFVIPLYLMGQLLRRVDDATAKRAVTVAVVLALIGAAAPLHLGTLIAITGGTLVAIADRRRHPMSVYIAVVAVGFGSYLLRVSMLVLTRADRRRTAADRARSTLRNSGVIRRAGDGCVRAACRSQPD